MLFYFCCRYKPVSMPDYPTCKHTEGKFQCKKLTMKDIKTFHKLFYKKPEREYQNHVVLKFVETYNVSRRRERKSKKGTTPKAQLSRTTKYFVPTTEKRCKLPVCMETFINILGISRFRVNNITKQFHENGFLKEKRGGFRQAAKYEEKANSVVNFLNRFQCIESHYCRGKSERKYLPSELNIRKLWKMYLDDTESLSVKQSFFRKIFNTRYNLGFGTPRTDVCSTCLSLTEKIKIENDSKKRLDLMIEKRVHNLKAKAFYEKLKDKDKKILILSFDCQKNLPLPKVPDQSVYYSRQVYVQNLTIVIGNSKSKLSPSNVYAYCWTENEFVRDSNVISSCVYDILNSVDLSTYTKIRLVSDGCAGQNKNSAMLGMCVYWLKEKAPAHIQKIEIVYPITGHSYLPPDRVFGLIEKKIKKVEVLIEPEKVYEIISEFAFVKLVGKDINIFDFKKLEKIP